MGNRFSKLFDDDDHSGSEKRKSGRPRGRHTNPDYVRLTVYLPFELKQQLLQLLLDESTPNYTPNQSEAVEVLLQGLIDKEIDRDWFCRKLSEGS